MDMFKKPECKQVRKIKGGKQGEHQNETLESSLTSVSASTSLCSQQSKHSRYDCVRSLYKSVLDESISSNQSKVIHNSSGLHSEIKKFGQSVWEEYLKTTKDWQTQSFYERYKELKTRAAMSNGNLHKKMATFERWSILIKELGLCIKGFVENKNVEITTDPIIKRMDSHTVASQKSLYKLKKFSVEGDDASDIPHFIINRFARGFPEDWKLLKKKWIMFLQEGKPRDFQWEGNDNATSSDKCCMYENPSGHSLQQSSCEEFTTKTQDRNFAFSALAAKNKLTERAIRLHSYGVSVENRDTVNIENCLYLEEERINNVGERNDPQCSKSATTTKENFLQSKRNLHLEEERINNVAERNDPQCSKSATTTKENFLQSKRNLHLEEERINQVAERNDPQCIKSATTSKENFLQSKRNLHLEEKRMNQVAERNDPQCSKSATTSKENFPVLIRSFEIVTNDSENSDNERAVVLNKQTNFQYGKRKANQHENKKKQSDEKRRTNTTKAMVGNEILLEKWLPILNENQLCFRGVRSVGCAKKSYTTASVKSRLKRDVVTLVGGNTCKLIGDLYDEHKCLPEEIRTKFQSGIPAQWRKELALWIVFSKSTEVRADENSQCILCSHIIAGHCKYHMQRQSTTAQKDLKDLDGVLRENKSAELSVASATRDSASHLDNQQQGSLKTSSRGRILLQPVKHWLGETPSSVINNLVDQSKEKQVEVLNPKNSHHTPAEKELSSISDKEKCRTSNKPDALPQKNVKNAANSKRKKELIDKNVKKNKKEQQSSRPDSEKDVNSEPMGGNSCPDTQFENPTYFANSERRVLRSRNKQSVVQKESSNAILNEKKIDGIGKNTVSSSNHSHKKISGGKLKENEKKSDGIGKNTVSSSNQSHKKISGGKLKENAIIPVLDRDNKDSTSAGKSKHTVKRTNKKDEGCSLKMNDIGVDFTDFLGKPPRSLKQRKKLDKIVKTLSQKNKKNVDLFDGTSEGDDNTRAEWNDFIAVKDVASFNIGEETPRSKMLSGSYFKTPDASPSTSIFQLTPCDNGELMKYVHQQKTRNDKPAKKTDTKKTKLLLTHTSSGNHAGDDLYAALIRGEPISKHIISQEMRIVSDDSDSFSEFSY